MSKEFMFTGLEPEEAENLLEALRFLSRDEWRGHKAHETQEVLEALLGG